MDALTERFSIKVEPESLEPSSSRITHHNIGVSDVNRLKFGENDNRILETEGNTLFKPEFVNIKKEPGLPDTVKLEPLSPSGDAVNWHSVPVKYEPGCHNFNVQVSIKEEPTDTETPATTFEPNTDYIIPDFMPEIPKKPCKVFISDVSDSIIDLSSKVSGKHRCPVCQKIFANKGNVTRHIIRTHARAQLECNTCFKKFTKHVLYKKHILTHSSEKRFKCGECDKRFRTSSNLEQHKRIHLAVKPFHCKLCTRQFAVKANLVKHQGSGRCKVPHQGPLICTTCNKVFQREFLLKSHLRKHTTERPFTCDKCKMCFKYKSTLIRHVQLHNNIKPYSCEICNKKFTHSGLIKPHMRKHTGEKPYTCEICNKKFAHKHNMQRHAQRHAKEKNLVCSICQKKFPKESRLIYHMRTHTNAKPFICGVCPKTFSHKQNIIRHYGRKHPNHRYECKDTDASVAKEVWEKVVLQNKGLESLKLQVNIKQVDSSDDEVLSNIKTEEIIGK